MSNPEQTRIASRTVFGIGGTGVEIIQSPMGEILHDCGTYAQDDGSTGKNFDDGRVSEPSHRRDGAKR